MKKLPDHSMDKVTFDTNVLIRYGMRGFPTSHFMSAVVVQELTAGALDTAQVRRLDLIRLEFESTGKLLVPTGEDQWHAGKVLNSLHRGLPSFKARRAPAISKEEQQRLVRDVLIARTAKRVNATLVTENLADFKKIRRFCDVKVVSPSEFFRAGAAGQG